MVHTGLATVASGGEAIEVTRASVAGLFGLPGRLEA
jgi:hypothetical protein